jgi:hypothetical protein
VVVVVVVLGRGVAKRRKANSVASSRGSSSCLGGGDAVGWVWELLLVPSSLSLSLSSFAGLVGDVVGCALAGGGAVAAGTTPRSSERRLERRALSFARRAAVTSLSASGLECRSEDES